MFYNIKKCRYLFYFVRHIKINRVVKPVKILLKTNYINNNS